MVSATSAIAAIIMICVNSAEDVEALLTGADGLLARPAPGLVIVDHTTGSPQMVDKLDRLARAAAGATPRRR